MSTPRVLCGAQCSETTPETHLSIIIIFILTVLMILTKCSPHIQVTHASVGSSSPLVATLARTPETNFSLIRGCQSNTGKRGQWEGKFSQAGNDFFHVDKKLRNLF